MSTELPKIGFLLWVEIEPSTLLNRLMVDDDGKVTFIDTLTLLPDGRGGHENLTEEVTIQSVAEGIADVLAESTPGGLWSVAGVRPGAMAE